MDKDRDISRTISTPITPRKVGLVGSAFLAGSAAIMAACGGGSAKSARTPEGAVGGAFSNPTTGSTIHEVKTVMPSATVRVEVPTVAPTATLEAVLTQDQVVEIANKVKGLITTGFVEVHVTGADITKTGDPSAADSRYADPDFVLRSVNVCVTTKYGEPFTPVYLSGIRTIEPGDKDYSSRFLNMYDDTRVLETIATP